MAALDSNAQSAVGERLDRRARDLAPITDDEETETSEEGGAVDRKCSVEVVPVKGGISKGGRGGQGSETRKTDQVLRICRIDKVSSAKIREKKWH